MYTSAYNTPRDSATGPVQLSLSGAFLEWARLNSDLVPTGAGRVSVSPALRAAIRSGRVRRSGTGTGRYITVDHDVLDGLEALLELQRADCRAHGQGDPARPLRVHVAAGEALGLMVRKARQRLQ